MKEILKGLISISAISLTVMACTSSPQKGKTVVTPTGQRIYIPQEKITIEEIQKNIENLLVSRG